MIFHFKVFDLRVKANRLCAQPLKYKPIVIKSHFILTKTNFIKAHLKKNFAALFTTYRNQFVVKWILFEINFNRHPICNRNEFKKSPKDGRSAGATDQETKSKVRNLTIYLSCRSRKLSATCLWRIWSSLEPSDADGTRWSEASK